MTSNLKHLSPEELRKVIRDSKAYQSELKDKIVLISNQIRPFTDEIGSLQGKINNMDTRIHWANIYLDQKTKTSLTKKQIEHILGYEINIIDEQKV